MESRARVAFRAIWSSLTIVVVLAVVAGCSDKRSDAGGSTTTVKRTSTTTTTTSPASSTSEATAASSAPTANDAVLAAYLAFWDMYIELGGTPPPFDAATVNTRLDERTTGAEKAQLFDFLQNNAGLGLVLRGDIVHSPTATSNDGTVAVVTDCMDDRIGVYRVADNSRTDTDDPARHLYTVSLRQDDGRWRVETVSMGSEPCTA